MTNTQKGIMYAFIASIISGIAVFYAKISVAKIDPLVLTTSRNLFAGLLLLITYAVSFYSSNKSSHNITLRQLPKLLLISIIGGSIPFFLFFTGLKLMNAQTANLIQKSLFIWVGIASLLIFKQKLNLWYLMAFVLVYIANYVVNPFSFTLSQGMIMVLGATLLWSVENLAVQHFLRNTSESILSVFRMLGGGIFLFLITIITGKLPILLSLSQSQLITIIVGGSILSAYVYFWYKALKYAPASVVTLVLTFSLAVGNILNGSLGGIKISHQDIMTSIFIATAMIPVLILAFRQKNMIFNKS